MSAASRPDELTPDPAALDQMSWWDVLTTSAGDFFNDDALTQAAAVAFYTALSFAPLLILVIVAFGQLDQFGGFGTQERVIQEIRALIGSDAAGVVQQVQEQHAKNEISLTSATGLLSIAVLLWSASGVFSQLQAALNAIWDVEQAPGNGIVLWLRKRGLSITIVFAILFLLLVSLVITAMINAAFRLNDETGLLWQAINLATSLAIYVLAFAVIFKYLPDVRIPWRVVWFGSVVTSILFALGKSAIGLYLAYADVGDAYGGARSIVILLVWVYFSALIMFFGAELTQSWAKRAGLRVKPSKIAKAVPTKKDEPANQKAPNVDDLERKAGVDVAGTDS